MNAAEIRLIEAELINARGLLFRASNALEEDRLDDFFEAVQAAIRTSDRAAALLARAEAGL